MALTAKQENFCQAIADGKTQADAYRLAYNALNMKAESIHCKASILMSDGKVSARVDELKKALAAKQLWSREQSVNVLVGVINEADAGTTKIAATKELNAMFGFNAPTKSELSVSGGIVIIPAKHE